MKTVDHIKSQLKEKNIKQVHIVKYTGLSKSTIWRILTRKVDPKTSTLEKIQDYIDSLPF